MILRVNGLVECDWCDLAVIQENHVHVFSWLYDQRITFDLSFCLPRMA